MEKIQLGIIGCGNMSQAIAKALLQRIESGEMAKNGIDLSVSISDIDEEKLAAMQKKGAKTTKDNAFLVASSDYVLLAVKPQSAQNALDGIDFSGKIVISIMAGVTLARLSVIAKNGEYVRVMPNLNARIGLSYNAYCSNISAGKEKIVKLILDSFGVSEKVGEDKINAVTGLTGSSPAFVFKFIKAFIDEGMACGFDAKTAKNMAIAAIEGSARLAASEDTPIEKLIESVCSKGGTTIEGVKYLDSVDMEGDVRTAIKKAIDRANELQ